MDQMNELRRTCYCTETCEKWEKRWLSADLHRKCGIWET